MSPNNGKNKPIGMSLWAYYLKKKIEFGFECKTGVLILLYDSLGYCDHSQPL